MTHIIYKLITISKILKIIVIISTTANAFRNINSKNNGKLVFIFFLFQILMKLFPLLNEKRKKKMKMSINQFVISQIGEPIVV
jgi:hypothetical protein